jgi:hypothetical protein
MQGTMGMTGLSTQRLAVDPLLLLFWPFLI